MLKRSQPTGSGRGAAQTVTLESSDPPKDGADGASASADVRVAVNGTSARLVGLDPASFPADFPAGAPRLRVILPAAMLAEMIDATLYAVSPDEARYNLSGVLFERAGNQRIRMVATDGHRLALTERPLATERFAPFIIPRKLLVALRTALRAPDWRRSHDSADTRHGRGAKQRRTCGASGHRVQRGGRALQGTHGRRRVSRLSQRDPEGIRTRPGADRLARYSAACEGAVMPFSNARYHGVRLAFASGRLTVSASDPERGEASEGVAAKGDVRDAAMAAGFNASYLLGAIATLGDELVFRLADPTSPCVITTAGAADSPQAVIMPMRL